MKLFSIHCGFYDEELSGGIYEFHINISVVADTVEDAKLKVRQNRNFQKKKMHIDGIEQITAIDGFRLLLVPEEHSEPPADLPETVVLRHQHRDL